MKVVNIVNKENLLAKDIFNNKENNMHC